MLPRNRNIRYIHFAVQTCTSYQNFKMFITPLLEKNVIEEVLTVDDDGKTVFDLVKKNPNLSASDIENITTLLIDYALKKPVRPMTSLITDQEIAELEKEFNLIPGSEEHNHFMGSIGLINKTRRKFEFSTSHSQKNNASPDAYPSDTEHVLMTLRSHYEQRVHKAFAKKAKINLKNDCAENRITFHLKIDKKNFKAYDEYFLSAKTGNCNEMTRYAHRKGLKRGLPMTSYQIPNGDHTFTSVGNFTCDPWGGTPFPMDRCDSLLRTHIRITHQGREHEFSMSYNPKFHQRSKVAFYGTESQLTKTVTFSDSFADQLIQKIVDQLSKPEDKFIFAVIIRNNLAFALEEDAISQTEIEKWRPEDLISNLRKYFYDDITYTPLMIARYKGYESLFEHKIKKAIAKGVDMNQTNPRNESVLYYAASLGYTKCVKMLLATPVKQNIVAPYGLTALFNAALNGHEECVDLLLRRPDTLLMPVTASADVLRKLICTDNQTILKRFDAHIAMQVQGGATEASILITPQKIATIMGHDTIAIKLKNFAISKAARDQASLHSLRAKTQSVLTITKSVLVGSGSDDDYSPDIEDTDTADEESESPPPYHSTGNEKAEEQEQYYQINSHTLFKTKKILMITKHFDSEASTSTSTNSDDYTSNSSTDDSDDYTDAPECLPQPD